MDTNNEVLDKPVSLEKIGGGICYGNQTWLTTEITEIESDVEVEDSRCITFKTKNSSYKLYISKL